MNKRAEQIHHIEQWRASGLSQSEYSRRQGLKVATFNYWVRRMDAERSYSAFQSSAGFVPVHIASSGQPTSAQTSPLVVRTTRGYRLELPADTSPRWLAELLQCLG